jgi:hypothetical protein
MLRLPEASYRPFDPLASLAQWPISFRLMIFHVGSK